MRQLMTGLSVLALTASLARADEKDAKKLEGTYSVVALLVAGKPDEKKAEEASAFIIKDGTITIKLGKRDETAKFTVDPSKKPAHIDILPGSETVQGIYETKDTDKGLELMIAFSKGDNAERPKDFKGERKNDIVIKLLRPKEK